ncbi:uncharacterized protein SOCG_01912 [Schizosaccharomyces octosporus yFS286]|uniref:Zn(2)-C6 fungal-type domain-containing protein n=1 Tax=Schizosaccharomyces octosporus (strain yFS286) TaxID=483514 RepID=S9PW47_SCHOY|nr:uncharacterized protein SOCG_01912 [Schizosaccharomyces octosporus yFS286]EPX71698.1 hypothetical protein SOCG_01912 [Schizosaccharomyces octosporus yFS286]
MKEFLQKRTRTKKACLVCHRKKRKCSGTFPCSYCQKLRHKCQYEPGVIKNNEHPTQNSQLETEYLDKQSLKPDNSSSISSKHTMTNRDFCVPKNNENNYNLSKEESKKPVCFADIIGDRLGVASTIYNKPYAWNLGSRIYSKRSEVINIKDILSQDDCRFYASIYFEDVNPIFGLLDATSFFSKLKSTWSTDMEEEFEALVCIIILLGSYFSHTNSLANELEFVLIELTENLLKSGSFPMAIAPTITKIVIFVLKSVYLRNIADPADAWLASCTSMHLVEIFCANIDLWENQKNYNDTEHTNNKSQSYLPLYNVIMVSEAFHKFLAMEIGSTPIRPSRLNSGLFFDSENLQFQGNHLVQLVKALPQGEETIEKSQITMVETVLKISQLSQEQPNLIALLKGSISFHMYRKLILTGFHLDESTIEMILKITDEALNKCLILCDKGIGWWNVLDVPFHGVCVLLSMDTRESLLMIPKAYNVLKQVVRTFNTVASKSALQIASDLCCALRYKKLDEANILSLGGDEGTTSSYDMDSATSDLLMGNPFFDLFNLEI